MSDNAAKKQLSAIEMRNIEQLKKAEDMYYSALGQPTVRKYPEEDFKKYFLAVFCGEYRKPDIKEVIGAWYEVAGGPFDPVDLVNPKGEIVARVPPLYNRKMVRLIQKRGEVSTDVNLITAEAESQSLINPNMAFNRLNSSLQERYLEVDGTKMNQDLTAQWETFLNRYGKSTRTQVQASSSTMRNATGELDSDLDY